MRVAGSKGFCLSGLASSFVRGSLQPGANQFQMSRTSHKLLTSTLWPISGLCWPLTPPTPRTPDTWWELSMSRIISSRWKNVDFRTKPA